MIDCMLNEFKKKLIKFLGSTFYSGYITKKFPGTIGSIVALISYIIFLESSLFSIYTHFVIILVSFILSVWAGNHTSECFDGKDDPKELNMDEVCGQYITFLPLTIYKNNDLFLILLSFFVFRFFDIIKPFPISYVDKNVKNGIGITVDDVLAGIYSIIILEAYIYIFQAGSGVY